MDENTSGPISVRELPMTLRPAPAKPRPKKYLSYADQLKHPKWQKRRLEIMELDEFKCHECGDTESTLNVHHKRYRKGAMAWEYDDWELVTLCDWCHHSWHESCKTIKNFCHLWPLVHLLNLASLCGDLGDSCGGEIHVFGIPFPVTDDPSQHLSQRLNDLERIKKWAEEEQRELRKALNG